MTKFRLQVGETGQFVCLRGTDDHGNVFEITLDRVWVGNLIQELEQFMSGAPYTERELRRVDL